MSAVVGIDLSSRALDLVKLEEDSNRAEWVRCELAGANAWERTLGVRDAIWKTRWPGESFFEDVYLVALEAPYGRGQAGTNAILNRVVGAVAASLPSALRSPERCWIVRPDEYRTALGFKHNQKPTWADISTLSGDEVIGLPDGRWVDAQEHFRDAYALAWWARDTNARAVAEENTG